MIHRQNWLDVRTYLHHIERVKQNDIETVKRARSHLRHLLEWADSTPLPKARSIDPTFPAYLLTARSDGKEKTLASASVTKCLANARQFFGFSRKEHPLRYKAISESWIELLHPPRHLRQDARLPVRQFYTLEEVRHIASVATETLREERGKVAVCMLYLSGMRADALASIPISCVDLPNRALRQLPDQGVRTKNRKAAITYLLDIPELLDVVAAWDSIVGSLPPAALWYATLTRDGMTITAIERAFQGRHNVIERDVRLICDRAGLPYKPPHQLRHGHIVFARSLARTPEEIKAISQNVMHANSIITDQVYAGLVTDRVASIITTLGKNHPSPNIRIAGFGEGLSQSDIQRLIEILQAQLPG